MATTYRIKGWSDDVFLKRDAVRGKKPPPWVSIPTSMDGLGMRTLATTKGGVEAYGAFIMIVAIVARLDTEGGHLIDGDHVLDAALLAKRTGCPEAAFDRAIPLLESVGWLLAANLPHLAASSACGTLDLAPTPHHTTPHNTNTDTTPTPSQKTESEHIEEIYQAYPVHKGKGQARKAIKAALKKIPFDDLLPKVQAYAESVAPKKGTDDWQYVPHPATWFNGERWADEPDQKPEPMNMDRFYDDDGRMK